jgi:hypothetical protein
MTSEHGLAGRDVVLATLADMLGELRGLPDWENVTLERYLEALTALLGSVENHYANTGQSTPDDPWRIIAEVLKGARYYE